MTAVRPKKVVLFGDGGRADVRHAMAQLRPLLAEKAEIVSVCVVRETNLEALDFDLLFNFGGDGSILGAARAMGARQRPIVGVNFGKVGFLAKFSLPEVLVYFDQLVAPTLGSDVYLREGLLLSASLIAADQKHIGEYMAVNDVVISRGRLSRIVRIECSVDGAYVTRYDADGIIVSTPIGSTAHSLSAGGPILEPDMDAMLVTPICPHALAIRPLVIPASRSISLEVVSRAEEAGMTIDGQEHEVLHDGWRIVISASPHRIKLLGCNRRGFYDNLRQKLYWGGSIQASGDVVSSRR